MIFVYQCGRGHDLEVCARRPDNVVDCPLHSGLNTPVFAARNLAAELRSQFVVCDDPIRRSYNGAKIDHNLAEQQRPLDPLAPKDKFDLKRIEKATGRVYCGDEISHLSPKAQKAILGGDKFPGRAKPRL